MNSPYPLPPESFDNMELLKEHFRHLHYLNIDTLYFYKKFCFQLLKREYHHSLTAWYLFNRIEKIFKSIFLIFDYVIHEQMQDYLKESREFCYHLVLLAILSFLLVKSYGLHELENHFPWWRETIRLITITQVLKCVFKDYQEFVECMGLTYVIIRMHLRFIERLQNAFKELPTNIKYLKFESKLLDFQMSIFIEKFFEIYLFKLFSAAINQDYKFVYDYSNQTHKISSFGMVNLLLLIQNLPPNMVLDISGNQLFSLMSMKNRDRFLLQLYPKRDQIIYHDNGESELQRVFLPLLSLIKQKNIPYEIVIHLMINLVEPQEIRYLNEKYNRYIFEKGDIDYLSDEDAFYPYYYLLPPRNQTSCFLPPFQDKWLEDPAFRDTLKKNDKNCFDNLLIEHSLFQLLKEHPLSKVVSNPPKKA